MALLITSLLALAVGPLLHRVADRARASLLLLDGFVMAAITGLVVVHIIPHAMEAAGIAALGVALLGFLGPQLVEHLLKSGASKAHMVTLTLALLGLVVHTFFDGAAIAAPLEADRGRVSLLALAVVLHRLPIGVTVWWLLRSSVGERFALGALAVMAGSTVAGFALGDGVAGQLGSQWLALFQAAVAGSLLHVVLHRPAPLQVPPGTPAGRLWGGVGAIAGILAVTLFADTHLPAVQPDSYTFGVTFTTLALESAPALLLAFALAGVVQVILPHASLRWMARGRPTSQTMRGVAFGLPLPICSCGVIPLYQTLVTRAVPATAAMAFLVATPELGLDAILISLPLLGAELTLLRVLCAAFVAVVVGWTIGRLADARKTAAVHQPPEQTEAVEGGWLARARAGIRFGFGEIVDHVGPWLILGIAIASLVEPLLSGEWLMALPWGADVILFTLLGMPSYVCASGATPLVAVLIHKGVSPGAAIAFLLAGPATNVTTFGILSRLHGRRIALAFGGAILALSVGLGFAVNGILPETTGISLHDAAERQPTALGIASLAALTVVFILSILRQGPRGFLGQIISPYGEGEHGHDHEHL